MMPSCESSYGWSDQDTRYYFSYYTTLGRRSDLSTVMETMLYIVIMLASLITNATIIFAIIRRKNMQTVTNCFIANLAVADLIFAFSIPAIAVARASPTWNLGESACKLLPYSQFVCGSVLLWTLTTISIERARTLTIAPFHSGLTRTTAMIFSALTWILALLIFLPVAMFFTQQKVQYNSTATEGTQILANATVCTLVFPKTENINLSLTFTITMVVLSCVLPMIILVFNFRLIYKKLHEIQVKLEKKLGFVEPNRSSILTVAGTLISNLTLSNSTEVSQNEQLSRKPSLGSFCRLKKHKRATRILFWNIFAVLAMWLPITIVLFLIYHDGHRENHEYFLANQYFIWAVIIALMNTIVNPFIYGFLTENFRVNYKVYKWIKKNTCIGWIKNLNINSTQNSKNQSASTFCVESPIPVQTRETR